MKNLMPSRVFALPPLVCGACLLFASATPCAHAASSAWKANPTDGVFNNDANWTNGAPGGAAVNNQDVATFNVASTVTSLTLNAGLYNLGSFAFAGSASAFTFDGPGTFVLTSGGSINLAADVQNDQTFNTALTLGSGANGAQGTYSFLGDSNAAALKITGTVSSGAAAGGTALTLGGAGTAANEISGTVTEAGSGSPTSLVKAGAGVWTLSGNNSYSGTTTINGGTLRLTNAAGSVSSTGGNVLVNSGGTLAVGGNAQITGGSGSTFTLAGGTLQVINSNLTTAIGITLGGNVYSTINTNGQNATVNGAITGSTSGLIKSGVGTLTLGSAGSNIGSVLVTRGTVAQRAGSVLTTSELAVGTGTGNVGNYNLSGGTLNFAAGTPPALVGGSASSFRVGDFGGTGTFTQTGGTTNVNGSMNVGNQGGNGTYGLSAGTLNLGDSNGLYSLGRTNNANATTGVFNLSGTGVVNMNGDSFIVGDREAAGAQGVGTLNQSGGTFTVNTGRLFLGGYGAGNAYNLSGGTLQVGGNSLMGLFGGGANTTGSYSFNLGTATIQVIGSDLNTSVNANLTAGLRTTVNTNGLNATWNGNFTGATGGLTKTGTGDLNLAGTANTIASLFDVAGSVTQNTAASSVTVSELSVGFGAGGTSTYNLSAGTLATTDGTPPALVGGSAASFRVGDFGGTGTFNQTGGVANVYGSLNVGNQGGSGTYNLSAGSLNLLSGNGIGLYSLGRTTNANATTGVLNLSGTGLVNMNGDSFIVGDREIAGAQGVGTVNQTGGTFTVNAGNLFLGGYGAGNAYNLSGGTLQVGGGSLQGLFAGQGTNTTGSYNFNLGGGIIQVVGSNLNTSVNANLVSGTYSTVNTNGLNATWNGTFTGANGGLIKSGAGDFNLAGAGNTIGTAYVTVGSMTQNTAASSVTYGALQVAEGNGSTATYNLSAGTLNTAVTPPAIINSIASALLIGDFGGVTGPGAVGTFNQTGGTVNVNGSLNVGNQGGSGTYNLSAGSLNLLNGGINSLGRSNRTAAGTGTINLSGTGLLNMNGYELIIGDRESAGAQGVGVVNQTGGTLAVNAGTLYLGAYGNGNTYNLSGGTLQVGGDGLRGNYSGSTGSYSFNLGGGTLQVIGSNLNTNVNANVVAGAFASTINTNGLNATWNGALTGTGILVKSGAGDLNLTGSSNAIGNVYVTAGSMSQTTASSATTYGALQIGEGAGSTATYNLSAGTLATVNNLSSLLAVGDFSGTGTFNQTGGVANVYGSLNVGNQGGSGTYNLSAGSLNLLSSNGGLNSLGRSNRTDRPAGTGVLNLSGTGVVNMSADSFIVGDREIAGGQGVGTVNQTGGTFTVNTGRLYLGGYGANNAYNLSGGTLQVGGGSLQGLFAGQGTNTTGSYAFNLGGGTLQVIGSDLGTGVTPTLTASTSSTVDTNGFNATLNGTINGAGALVKAGVGTLTLPTANTYSGGTTVNAGSLLVSNPADSATGSGAVTINTGGTLLGTGAINAGANTVTVNGTLSPGASAGANGTINIKAGSLTLNSSSTLAFDITSNPSAKDLVVLGSSNLSLNGGRLALNLGSGFDYTGTYQLFTGVNNATLASIGGFGTVTGYDSSMYAPTFSLNGGDYDLSFTAVPEPTTVLGGLLLVGAAGWRQRRRLCGWVGIAA